MGVPKYFRHIIKNYDNLLNNVPNSSISIDNLYFDMNSLIHPCIQHIINEYPSLVTEYNFLEENDKKFQLDPDFNTEFEMKFYEYFEAQLSSLTDMIKPTSTIYYAIDGVAPRAKMEQQRIRRYRSVKENDMRQLVLEKYNLKKPSWDRNAITPGTAFMYRLAERLKNKYIPLMKNSNPSIQYILDDASVIGEGEHKIFDYIRKSDSSVNKTHCIYGLDADLIMLSLCSKVKMYLLREAPQFDKDINTDYVLFNIDEFKKLIINKFTDSLKNEDIEDEFIESLDHNQLLYNYVFLCFIFGNDFLPKIIGMDLSDETIEYILTTYIHQFGILRKHIIDIEGHINLFPLRQFFVTIYASEEHRINNYFKNNISKLLNFVIPTNGLNELKNELNLIQFYPCTKHQSNTAIYKKFQRNDILHDWMDTYYQYYFNIGSIEYNQEHIQKICNTYVDGLQWNISYYIEGCPCFKWHYPYSAAPCLRDICKYLRESFRYPHFEKGHYKPLEQLSMVLPIQSKQLLPSSYQKVMTQLPLEIYYPVDFELDTLFHIQLYECHTKLMNINDKDIIDVYEKLDKTRKLSKFEKMRNKVGKLFIM
jgi:5'-3' exoribonuclease 1